MQVRGEGRWEGRVNARIAREKEMVSGREECGPIKSVSGVWGGEKNRSQQAGPHHHTEPARKKKKCANFDT